MTTVAPPVVPARPSARDVLGPQPRWRAVPRDALHAHPRSAIASLRVHIARPAGLQAAFTGTGWLAGPRTLVTAAHVLDVRRVWTPDATGWHVEVIPALGFGLRPFGSFWARGIERHPSWNGVAASEHDVAVVHVETPFPPDRCLNAEGRAHAPRVCISGYPFVIDHGETPVEASGAVGAVENGLMFYDVDVDDGQSGSPVFPGEAPSATVIGIHCGGTGHGSSPVAQSLNTGLMFRSDLVEWIAQRSL